MIKSSSIEILRSLDSHEFRQFGKFVRSPYFNENSGIVNLYDILKKYYPGFDSKNFSKEKIHRRLYPKKKYNDTNFRKLLSDLKKLLEEFLTYSSLNGRHLFERKTLLLEKLDSIKQDRLFEKELSELETKLKSINNIEDEFFINNYFLSTLKTDYVLGRGKMGNFNEIINNSLESFKYLICYSLIITFKIGNDLHLLRAGGVVNYSQTLLFSFIKKFNIKNFIEDLKSHDPNLYPVVSIYYHNFMVVAGEDAESFHFNSLKKLVDEYLVLFSRFEKYILMRFLENSCFYKIKQDKKYFENELFEVYKKMFAEDLFTARDADFMPIISFERIVKLALDLKQPEWAENFINICISKIHPEYRIHVKNYCAAQLFFYNKDYLKTIELVSTVKFYEFHTKMSVRSIILKSYYELNYIEEMLYMLDSDKHTSKDDLASWQKKFSNFLKFLERILKLKLNNQTDSALLSLVTEDLLNTDAEDIMEKKWLEEKLAILEQKNCIT